MERTLLLVPGGSFYYFNGMKLPGVVVFPASRKVHGTSEMVWKTVRKLRLATNSLSCTGQYKDLQSSPKIIIFDFTAWLDPALSRDINRHKSPDAKCYLYSWNIVRDKQVALGHLTVCRKYDLSHYSYDESDCKQYGSCFSIIMYDENLCLPERTLTLGILFLGLLKGRKARILASH